MSQINPVWALLALLPGLASAMLLVKFFGKPPAQGRFLPIDGLRGFLAYFVFIHHSAVWYFKIHMDDWTVKDSNLFALFGEGSVALFFMITGFLFFTKLIDGRKEGVDWGRLYVSRFLRITPLYQFAMCLLFIIVALLSTRGVFMTWGHIFGERLRWIVFTIFGNPFINGVADTRTIMAGVTWTLPYEWAFYLSLPLLALLTGRIPPFRYFALGLGSVFVLAAAYNLDDMFGMEISFRPAFWRVMPFAGGLAAAVLARSGRFRRLAASKFSTLIILACFAAVLRYENAYDFIPLLLLSAAFALIACGNNLAGLLTNAASRMLGEISYSLYLLHGIFLYVTFKFVIGIQNAKSFSPAAHWAVVICVAPLVIFGCYATYRFIERPALGQTGALTFWLRERTRPLFQRSSAITDALIFWRGPIRESVVSVVPAKHPVEK